MRTVAPVITVAGGVSIRARPRGRAMLDVALQAPVQRRVSIRARPRGRAMRLSSSGHQLGAKFQSAPGLEAGRCR